MIITITIASILIITFIVFIVWVNRITKSLGNSWVGNLSPKHLTDEEAPKESEIPSSAKINLVV